jgi:predicted dehydrogenase
MNIMTGQRFGVGIVGLQPGRGWAVRAHVSALRALPESYEFVGVANTSPASAERAAAATGLPRAFAYVAELIAAPEVDIVAVTVKVLTRKPAERRHRAALWHISPR